MKTRIVLCALMLLPLSAALADEATYTESGGSFTLGSSIDVTAASVGSPAGTLSLNCPVTSTAFGTYLWQYFCSGGTITMQSSDGLTVLEGTFTSGTLSLTASGGGRGGNTHYYYSFLGSLTGTLSHSGQSEAIFRRNLFLREAPHETDRKRVGGPLQRRHRGELGVWAGLCGGYLQQPDRPHG